MHSPKKDKPPVLDDYNDRDNDILNLYRLTYYLLSVSVNELRTLYHSLIIGPIVNVLFHDAEKTTHIISSFCVKIVIYVKTPSTYLRSDVEGL